MKKFILALLFFVLLLAVIPTVNFEPIRLWLSTLLNLGNSGPPIVSLEKLSELVTLKVRIKTTLIGENDWYTAHWELEGDACFATDCSQANPVLTDSKSKTLTLRLPEPRVFICRVDHANTRLLYIRSRSWNPLQLLFGNPNELRDEAMKHAQQKLEEEAKRSEWVAQAKEQAEINLRRFYQPLGYNVTVEWQQKPTAVRPNSPSDDVNSTR